MNYRLIGCTLLLALLSACGGGGGSTVAPPSSNNAGNTNGSVSIPPRTSASRFAYVAGTTGISAYSVNLDDGNLTEIAGSPFARDTHPSSVRVGPSDQFVYSAASETQTIHAYRMDHATGALSEIVDSPSAAGTPFNGYLGTLVLHPSGKFVYAVDVDRGAWAYSVTPSGTLEEVEGSPFGPGGYPRDMAIDPSGQYAFVAALLDSRVYTMRIDPTSGALTQVAEARAGDQTSGVAVDPSGKFVFVVSSGGYTGENRGVWSFRIDPATGTLTQIGSVAAAAGTYPYRITVHPTGKFAYVLDSASNNISAFSVDAMGALTSIGTAVATGINPYSLTVDLSGRFAYVASYDHTNVVSGAISGYRIDTNTGILTEMDGSPLATTNSPLAMTITGML